MLRLLNKIVAKMGHLLFFCFLFLVHKVTSTEVIYSLSPENYARMPPKNHLDHYTHCLNQQDGVYCTAGADVVSDGPSELLDMMRGYSAYTMHYNYTRLRYGMCMTGTCREFYNGTGESDLQVSLEACLNETLSRNYGLKTRVTEMNCYFKDETKNKHKVDWVDWAVATFMFTIFALNIIGSVYDFSRDQTKPGNKFLNSFSCRLNWKQLMAPPSADPRAVELQSLNGIRFLTCLMIVMIHVPMQAYIAVVNPDYIEKKYDTTDFYVFYNGHLVTQSFFLMSGFLLVYNMQVSTEKQPFTLKKYFKNIFLRIMRLAPLSVVSVMLTATWLRFAGYGPLWQEQTGVEVDDCRNYWIYNVLFLNNWVDVSSCNLQAWSTANDLHLHIMGLTVILLAPSAAWRHAALGLLYAVGLLWPAFNVLTMDLDGTLIPEPEGVLQYYKNNYTFHYMYKRTYINIPVFIIGMSFGYIVYDLQREKVTSQDHTKYRYVYWLLVPLLLVVLMAGGFCFYGHRRASLLVRVLYGPIIKPVFGFTVMLIIFGAINKVETLYRGVLEWRGFVPLAKLSYSVYTFHMLAVRLVAGTRSTLLHFSLIHQTQEYFGFAAPCIILALVMYLAVEAPTMQLVKLACAAPPPAPSSHADKSE